MKMDFIKNNTIREILPTQPEELVQYTDNGIDDYPGDIYLGFLGDGSEVTLEPRLQRGQIIKSDKIKIDGTLIYREYYYVVDVKVDHDGASWAFNYILSPISLRN